MGDKDVVLVSNIRKHPIRPGRIKVQHVWFCILFGKTNLESWKERLHWFIFHSPALLEENHLYTCFTDNETQCLPRVYNAAPLLLSLRKLLTLTAVLKKASRQHLSPLSTPYRLPLTFSSISPTLAATSSRPLPQRQIAHKREKEPTFIVVPVTSS